MFKCGVVWDTGSSACCGCECPVVSFLKGKLGLTGVKPTLLSQELSVNWDGAGQPAYKVDACLSLVSNCSHWVTLNCPAKDRIYWITICCSCILIISSG